MLITDDVRCKEHKGNVENLLLKNLIVFDESKGVTVIYTLSKISFLMDQIRQYMFDMPRSFTNKILSSVTPLQNIEV